MHLCTCTRVSANVVRTHQTQCSRTRRQNAYRPKRTHPFARVSKTITRFLAKAATGRCPGIQSMFLWAACVIPRSTDDVGNSSEAARQNFYCTQKGERLSGRRRRQHAVDDCKKTCPYNGARAADVMRRRRPDSLSDARPDAQRLSLKITLPSDAHAAQCFLKRAH